MSDVFKRLNRLLRSKTAKSTFIVFSGNLTTAALGFFCVVIISRVLGPYNFGLFSTAIVVMAMVVGLADLGIGTGLVRFASLYLEKDKKRADVMFKLTFDVEILISLAILILGFIFARPLAMLILGKEELVIPLRLAFLGAASMSMGSYIVAVLQAWQSFVKLSLYSVLTNALKLSLVLLLFLCHYLRLLNVMVVYAIVPLFGLILGMVLIPRGFLREKDRTHRRHLFLQLFHFSKWIMLSYLANTVITRIDVLILSHYKGAEAVGIYSAAYQLSMVFPLIMGSLITVLMPQVSRLTHRGEFIFFMKKSLSMSTLIVVGLIPVFIFAKPLINLVFGTQYLASSGIFRILFVNFMINIVCNPIGTIVFALNKPMVTTYTNFGQLVISLVGNFLLIPIYGGYGAAYTFLTLTIMGSIIITAYVVVKVLRMTAPLGIAEGKI